MAKAALFQFNSFRSRIIVYVVLLLLLVLGTFFVSVTDSTYDNTRVVIDDTLQVGREVFDRLIAEREANFKVTFRALAADYAFREAYNETDFNTMLSVSQNLLDRTENADMLMVVDYDYLMVADTMRMHSPESEFPWPYLLEDAEEDDNFETTSFIVLDDSAYHIVAVPILTPLVDGWIIVGQRLDSDYVNSLKDITSTDVSIILESDIGTGKPVATTLDTQQIVELSNEYNAYFAGESQTGMFNLNGEEFVSLRTPLVVRDEITLSALVQQSLPDALAPYRELEQRLIVLFALGISLSALMALLLGRSVSQPVLSLVSRVHKIEQGDYSSEAVTRRSDEIGQLETSVNTMAVGLAEKEKVRDLLGKVVSREIAEELMEGELKLGGETRRATILFSDIRDFTNLCEGRAPESILEMLNDYLSEVTSAIEANKGVVDKYIGDAVMALFGAPISSDLDTSNALHAALAMKTKVDALNARNQAKGVPLMTTGIGLHTGEVVAGNLGSSNRMNYTVIGDTVNLASRLEALTKQYGAGIMVSEDTRNESSGFIYRELDMVRVKGKDQPVRIYELLGKEGEMADSMISNISSFEQALAYYRNCRWDEAEEILQNLLQQDLNHKLYTLFLERINMCRQSPPSENWDGVYTFESK